MGPVEKHLRAIKQAEAALRERAIACGTYQVAAAAELTGPNVSLWANGKRDVSAEMLARLELAIEHVERLQRQA